ncbi:MAG: hypothetical protein MI723_18705 [Caulobacterales bacterium]|nr:hypothetical protein [Caulobacterales bacterium]
MKAAVLAASALAVLSTPALAQNATNLNNATIGAQVNDIYGAHNSAGNFATIGQSSTAIANGYEHKPPMNECAKECPPSPPASCMGPECKPEERGEWGEHRMPGYAPSYGPSSYAAPGETASSYLPSTALVNNNVTVGAQVNTVQGYGNVAVNELEVGQDGTAVANGSGTALVNQNATIGAQVNTVLGEHNSALNSAGVFQSGAAVSQ